MGPAWGEGCPPTSSAAAAAALAPIAVPAPSADVAPPFRCCEWDVLSSERNGIRIVDDPPQPVAVAGARNGEVTAAAAAVVGTGDAWRRPVATVCCGGGGLPLSAFV